MKKSLESNYKELIDSQEEWQVPIFKSVAESIQKGLVQTKVNPLKIDAKAMGEMLWGYIQNRETAGKEQGGVLFKSGVFVVPKSHQIQQELYLEGFNFQYKSNFKKAIEAWEQSAALGNAGALAALGYGYQEFEDIEKDQQKGV